MVKFGWKTRPSLTRKEKVILPIVGIIVIFLQSLSWTMIVVGIALLTYVLIQQVYFKGWYARRGYEVKNQFLNVTNLRRHGASSYQLNLKRVSKFNANRFF